jgi:hypothetical protein
MNQRPWSILLPPGAPASQRLRTPADSVHCLNNSRQAGEALTPVRKARSGPGRRQVHSPTTSTPGPSPNPTDLSGKRSPRKRTSVSEPWGETSPLSPQTPLYPLSVPMGRRRDLLAEIVEVRVKNETLSCAKTDCQKRSHRTKTNRTRSPAPTAVHRHRKDNYATYDGRKVDHKTNTVTLSTTRRAHSFTCWR